ncbi:MAG: amidohydrolase family protein [Chryseosolibacter sp.]
MKRTALVLSCICLLMSCSSNDFYTAGDYASVKKIDTHTHPNTENTAMVEQAKEDNFILLAVNVDAPHYPPLDEQQRLALAQKHAGPDNVDFLTTISLAGWGAEDWADKTIARMRDGFDKGALGIKLWKNIGMVYRDSAGKYIMVDDGGFDPVIAFVKDQDKTVMAHLGEPKNCWLPLDSMTVNGDRSYYRNNPQYHMYQHPGNPTYEELIAARDRFVERHPDLRFVGAHLGSLEWSVDELAKRLDRFPNMAVDMAARISHLQYQSRLDREKVRDFIIRYKDRLIYATDAGMSATSDPADTKKNLHERWLADWKYFVTDETMSSAQVNGEFQGLKLPRDVVDHIYYKNAVKWFKIPPRK